MDRNEDRIRRAQPVEGQQLQRGRTVDEDVVIGVGQLVQGLPQQVLPPVHADHLHPGAGQLLVGGEHISPGSVYHAPVGVRAVDEDVVDVGGDGVFIHPQTGCGVGLGVKITEQDGFFRRMERGGQVDGGGGLSDTALLICDYNAFCHSFHRLHNKILSIIIE